jgi:hypothetical protein
LRKKGMLQASLNTYFAAGGWPAPPGPTPGGMAFGSPEPFFPPCVVSV